MFERGSIHLEESLRYEKVPSRFPESRLPYEHRTELIIHRHIEISFAVALIIIFHTVEFFGKGTDRFCEEGEFFHKECEFSLMCVEELSLHSYEISEVDQFLGEFVGGERFISWSS